MKCRKCGKEIYGKFCSNCGTCTEDVSQNNCSEEVCCSMKPLKQKGSIDWAIIAIILLITTAFFISIGIEIIPAVGVMSFFVPLYTL